MFAQPDPRQFPQAGEHSMLCFLHVHRRVLQSAMQLHLITRSRFSGARARYVCSGTKPMSALSHCCHPHSVGRSPPADPFHYWTCRYTLRLWYIAAPDVGGSARGWTWDVFDATFSQNRWCRRESRLSVEFPLCSTTNAFSPAHATPCLEAECVSSTLACWRNQLLAWNFFRETPFPIPWRRGVVSHPRTAYRKSMCWHMSGPIRCFVTLMFQMRGCFVFFFGSGQKKKSCDYMLAW